MSHPQLRYSTLTTAISPQKNRGDNSLSSPSGKLQNFKLATSRMMKWFKRKTKPKSNVAQDYSHQGQSYQPSTVDYRTPPSVPVSKELLNALPNAILERIFAFVCPHTQDDTYESCEQSAVEDSCMLCDLRDLSHCAQASRRWRRVAYTVM